MQRPDLLKQTKISQPIGENISELLLEVIQKVQYVEDLTSDWDTQLKL